MGQFESALTFDKVAIPPQNVNNLLVNSKRTTAPGTTVTLQEQVAYVRVSYSASECRGTPMVPKSVAANGDVKFFLAPNAQAEDAVADFNSGMNTRQGEVPVQVGVARRSYGLLIHGFDELVIEPAALS